MKDLRIETYLLATPEVESGWVISAQGTDSQRCTYRTAVEVDWSHPDGVARAEIEALNRIEAYVKKKDGKEG